MTGIKSGHPEFEEAKQQNPELMDGIICGKCGESDCTSMGGTEPCLEADVGGEGGAE